MKLLIIRPEPGASASAQRACAAGFEPVLLPFFEIRPVAWTVPDPAGYDAVLLTSANAARQAGDGLANLRSLPVHCVGERTAQAARAMGLHCASIGASDAGEALHNAAAAGHQRLFWLTGAESARLPKRDDVRVTRAICYESAVAPLPGDAGAMLASVDAVALHSSRAATLFSETVVRTGLDKLQFCIAAFSPAIACAAGTGWRAVAVADRPADSALLSALAELGKLPPKVAHRKDLS